MQLLISFSPSACVGSTHQWEVTQSSYSFPSSVMFSQFLIQPECPGRVEAASAVRQQKFSMLKCEALQLQLSEAPPAPRSTF